jgi:hypothetical protein
MINFNLSSTEPYSIWLRDEINGASAEDRSDAIFSRYNSKIKMIKKQKERQLMWVVAGYFVGILMFFLFGFIGDSIGDNITGVFIGSAFFMNMAAYNYGKYHFFLQAEEAAYNQAAVKWEREGSPIGFSYNKK